MGTVYTASVNEDTTFGWVAILELSDNSSAKVWAKSTQRSIIMVHCFVAMANRNKY